MKLSKYLLLTLLGTGMAAQAGTISVNFVDAFGVDDMLPADISGFPDLPSTHVANWNNVQAGGSGDLTDLVRENGTATAAALSFTSNLGNYRLPTTIDETSNADDRMWKGYQDVGGGTAAAPGATFTLTGIPFTGFYNVYVYIDGDNGGTWRVAGFQATSPAAPPVTGSGEDSENTNWGSGQNSAKLFQIAAAGGAGNLPFPTSPNNGEGNVVLLKAMKGSTLTLKVWGGATGDSYPRAPISGFQIVEASDNDTDNDGMSNDWETAHGLDPNSAAGVNGATGDPDGDTLTNLSEFLLNTDPQKKDTDGDGLNDNVEDNSHIWHINSSTNTGTDPLNADSDGDGLPDGLENPDLAWTGPTQPGTDPNKKDTDGDEIDDATEIYFGSNPKLDTSKPVLSPTATDLLAYWPFNDASNSTGTKDAQHGIPGQLLNSAVFSADGTGRSGKPGDLAIDLGTTQTNKTVSVPQAGFLNLAAAADTVTISYWQKLDHVTNSQAFFAPFVPDSGDNRGIAAHTTWSDNTFYWDTAGCCDLVSQRLRVGKPGDLNLTTGWHNIVLVKNGPLKEIWVDGVSLISGDGASPLPLTFSNLFIGSGDGGSGQTAGLIDDFAVFGDALTQNQILLLASGESPVTVAAMTDADNDGMPDAWEVANDLNKTSAADATQDPDHDNSTNLQEFQRATNPQNPDTDGDGYLDGAENGGDLGWQDADHTGTNPKNPDTDGDGLKDGVENPDKPFVGLTQTGTDPNKPDSDGDLISDLTELYFGSKPNDVNSVPVLSPTATDLLAYWPMDDSSQPAVTMDVVHGIPGTILNGAPYTADAGGHSGKPGDKALDLGDAQAGKGVRVDAGGFLNLTAAGDAIAVSYWQKLTSVTDSTAFRSNFVPGSGDARGISGHATWSNNNFYWDTAGCCDAGSQRINGPKPETLNLVNQWHHIVFQKNGPLKEIWVDGELIINGENSSPLPDTFGKLFLGSNVDGAEQTKGWVDDYAIFGDALTERQIKRLAGGESPLTISVPPAMFNITNVSRTTTTLTLTWDSVAQGSYTVRRSTTTTPSSSWQDVGTVTATGTSTTWTDTAPPAGRAFYYIRKN